jgi:hypothetical protein
MMNDPQTMEGSRVLAENLMSENISLETKLEKAFRRIICRKPKAKELEILTLYFESESDFFKKNTKKADMMLKIGEFKQKTIKDKNATAALMQTIQMIFNLEEAIVRG